MTRFVLFLLSNLSVMHHSCKQQTLLGHLFNLLHDKVLTSHQSFVFPRGCTQSGQVLPGVLAAGSGFFPGLHVSAVQRAFSMYWFQILIRFYSNH